MSRPAGFGGKTPNASGRAKRSPKRRTTSAPDASASKDRVNSRVRPAKFDAYGETMTVRFSVFAADSLSWDLYDGDGFKLIGGSVTIYDGVNAARNEAIAEAKEHAIGWGGGGVKGVRSLTPAHYAGASGTPGGG